MKHRLQIHPLFQERFSIELEKKTTAVKGGEICEKTEE